MQQLEFKHVRQSTLETRRACATVASRFVGGSASHSISVVYMMHQRSSLFRSLSVSRVSADRPNSACPPSPSSLWPPIPPTLPPTLLGAAPEPHRSLPVAPLIADQR